ncbi:hypothetical protein L486_03811 [Kwoniella mangroviensis CBS 10435]|uniref:Uncharacterized protein n=1 Tax=Kwoniella mangroviensis CBS 10435 TaxID=1331196 RepID=A0A1B9IUT9_9TREE|nr:hypothetical protein L486_03811 [Kwoniella mangroviensis CBS 10435]
MTGWDDGQIEGWRIMLERDPHRDDILSAHSERMSRNRQSSPPRDNPQQGSSRGGHGNRGGRGGGRGGSGGGQRGGRGGSKSSRGHSNAARTRGHDKKMSKMGAI